MQASPLAVGMANKWGRMAWRRRRQMTCLGLGRDLLACSRSIRSKGSQIMLLAIASARMKEGSSSLGTMSYPTSRVTWVPMELLPTGLRHTVLDRRSLGAKPMDVVFDSGSTYTYFTTQAYQATGSALKAGLSKSLQQVSDPSPPLCWNGQKVFKSVSDVEKDFKSLLLSFGKNSVMEIPPKNYLIITKNGNVCLGILYGSAAKLNFNVIGDITMQHQIIIYDNERGQLGCIRGSCSRSTKSTMSSFP